MNQSICLTGLLLVLLLLPGKGHAQQSPKLDSLLQRLETSRPDTNQMLILQRLAWESVINDPAAAIRYSNRALGLARTLKQDKAIHRNLRVLGYAYARLSDYPTSLRYAEASLAYARKIKYEEGIAASYGALAFTYTKQGDFNKGLAFYAKTLAMVEAVRDTAKIINCLYNIGNLHQDKGDHVQSVRYYVQVLRLAELRNDAELTALTSNSLANSLQLQGDLAKAREYYRRSLKWSRQYDKHLMAMNLINLGRLHFVEQNYAQALPYAQKALRIRKELGDKAGIRSALEHIGEAYFQMGQLQKAEASFREALATARQIGERLGMATAMIDLAALHQVRKEYRQGLVLARQGLKVLEELGSKEEIREGYQTLAALYEAAGDDRQALKSYKLFVQYKDSLSGQETAGTIAELHTRYDTQKKEQRIKVLSQQAQIQQLQLRQQHLYLGGLGVLVALMTGLGYLYFRHNTLRYQQKTILLEQKLLRTQLNPHFIFNALTAIQQFMYQHSAADAGRYLAKFAKLMRLILENSRQEYVSLRQEIQTLEHYLELQRLRFGDKFDYQIGVDPGLDPEEVSVPPMFAQPLVENSLEHGILHKSDRGLVQVRYHRQGDQLVLEVEDNGVGRQRAGELASVRRPEHVSLATRITQERIQLLNRHRSRKVKLKVEDLVDQHKMVMGTKATFAFPFKSN